MPFRGRLFAGFIALVAVDFPVPAAELQTSLREFRAGAALADITPDLGIPVGRWSSVGEAVAHVHDPLHVRALALHDGETALVFAVCDLLGVPQEISDEAKRLIWERSAVSPAHVVITGTHTHAAGSALSRPWEIDRPIAPAGALNSYQAFVARRIADAVQCAINNLEPARIGWGSGSEPSEVFNRRWFVRSEEIRRNPYGGVDAVRMNPPPDSPELIRPAGPVDPEIVFVSVQATGGRPIALLANYSLHYVGNVPYATISADYFAVFADRIQELLGADRLNPPFVGILTNGTSGDINNVERPASGPRPRQAPFERIREVAHKVAAEVHRAHREVEHRDWVKLDARLELLPLRPRQPAPEMEAYAKALLARPSEAPRWHREEIVYARRVLEMSRAPEILAVPLQAFRIGDLGIVAIPAEVFAEIGLEIKERTPFAKSFTLSLANGYMGYLPTVEQHRLGGYETWVGANRLEIEAAPKVLDTLLRLLGELR